MVWLPTVRADVVQVAVPLPFSGTAVQPEIEMVLFVNATVPVGVPDPPTGETVAVNVTDWFTVEGFTDEITAAVVFPAVPVPVNGIDCGLPVTLSVTTSVPGRAPVNVGLKVTETVQFPPTLTFDGVNGQVELVCE